MNLVRKEISAGIIIYRWTKEGPKFLLLYHGGRYWNFPKGKIEAKEGSYEAALREVREETGISRSDLGFDRGFWAHDSYAFTKDKQKVLKVVIYFLAEARHPHVRISEEHHGYGWFLYKDALRTLIYQNLKNNLKRAHDIIRGKSMESRPKHQKRQG